MFQPSREKNLGTACTSSRPGREDSSALQVLHCYRLRSLLGLRIGVRSIFSFSGRHSWCLFLVGMVMVWNLSLCVCLVCALECVIRGSCEGKSIRRACPQMAILTTRSGLRRRIETVAAELKMFSDLMFWKYSSCREERIWARPCIHVVAREVAV